MRKSFVLIILVAGVLAGCGSGGGSAKLSSGDVAVVGSQHISLAALNNELNRAKIAYKAQGQKFPKQGTTNYQAIRDNVITLLVEQAELEQKAASMGITVTEKEIDARVALVKKQYFGGSQKKYLAELKKQGFTEKQVRTDVFRPQLISEKVQKQITKDVKVSDADVQKYYDDNKSLYQQPASRSVRYILVGKSKATAQSVYQQLVKGGDKAWCTLAKKYAKDASGQNCGKATFSKGQTVAIFDTTAFTAPANKVVKPFYDPTQYKAWFVIEPLGPVKPASTTPEKQVAAQIKTTLLGTKQKKAVTDFSSSLTKSYCHGSKIRYQVGYKPVQDACTATTTNATTT
ncbi:MAG: SurA N-terminal domain-containing protein [Gaiellaceae bacterium]